MVLHGRVRQFPKPTYNFFVLTSSLMGRSQAGPYEIPGIPGSRDQNLGIFLYEIPGFFGICLKSEKWLFKVSQDLPPRPLGVKIFSQWGHYNGEKSNATNVDSCRRVEETFESTHRGKVKQMQPMWFRIYSGREFETAFESSQWREAKNATDVTLQTI